jgi:hypothetical protein
MAGHEDRAVSHGVFLSHRGRLWAFHATFTGVRRNVRMEAYLLREETGAWESRGIAAGEGFWPMGEPRMMEDGNFILPGIIVGRGNPAAVALSRGEDLTRWDVVAIPRPEGLRMWGESAVLIRKNEVINIARYGGRALALASRSRDFGRTWTAVRESNLPMTPSKPYTGVLSNRRRYLIGTTTADCGMNRFPLTIALTRPGEMVFSKVFRIRDRSRPGATGNHQEAKLAYPYAAEYDGNLHVIYSAGRRPANENDAELAVIPVRELS